MIKIGIITLPMGSYAFDTVVYGGSSSNPCYLWGLRWIIEMTEVEWMKVY